MIRQKQSLVHKVPSGVAILSHVCGDRPPHSLDVWYLVNMGRQVILVSYQWKK